MYDRAIYARRCPSTPRANRSRMNQDEQGPNPRYAYLTQSHDQMSDWRCRIPTHKGAQMPRVQVLTEAHGRAQKVMLTEHVPSEMFANEHYADQLVERMGWALVDAEEQEQAIRA